jgi:hypothetical protein
MMTGGGMSMSLPLTGDKRSYLRDCVRLVEPQRHPINASGVVVVQKRRY